MSILLTSAGLSTEGIRAKLREIAPANAKVGFIPTGRAVMAGDKSNHIAAIQNLQKAGFSWIDIIEISAENVDWQARLNAVDIVYLAGGNTFHLMHQLNKTGVGQWLVSNKDRKIYVGESAGSIVMTPNIAVASIDDGDVNEAGLEDLSGLGLVDFQVSPHTPEDVSPEANIVYAATISANLYAYNDKSALFTNGEVTECINKGGFLIYDNK